MEFLHLLGISVSDLLDPQFYIDHGGMWMIIFIVFAETGLFAGFFLPGDALLFVTGIYSDKLISAALFPSYNEWVDLGILFGFISMAGILGNFVGYWFGRKSGPYLFERKDSFLFKKKHLLQAHDFYEKNGGSAIIIARFIPFVRTFAPIVAGIVKMDKSKFAFYNIVGCVLWVSSMLLSGHFLQRFIMSKWNYDLKEHLEVIVLIIIGATTIPILWKLLSKKKKPNSASKQLKP
jgi:membrane-associated protein